MPQAMKRKVSRERAQISGASINNESGHEVRATWDEHTF